MDAESNKQDSQRFAYEHAKWLYEVRCANLDITSDKVSRSMVTLAALSAALAFFVQPLAHGAVGDLCGFNAILAVFSVITAGALFAAFWYAAVLTLPGSVALPGVEPLATHVREDSCELDRDIDTATRAILRSHEHNKNPVMTSLASQIERLRWGIRVSAIGVASTGLMFVLSRIFTESN